MGFSAAEVGARQQDMQNVAGGQKPTRISAETGLDGGDGVRFAGGSRSRGSRGGGGYLFNKKNWGSVPLVGAPFRWPGYRGPPL